MSHLPPEIDWGNPNPVPQPVIAPSGVGAARPVWLCITSPEFATSMPTPSHSERMKSDAAYEEYLNKKAQRREASIKKEQARIEAANARILARRAEKEANRILRHKLAEENKIKYAGHVKRRLRIKAPAPPGFTLVPNLSHIIKSKTLYKAIAAGRIPSIKTDGCTYVDEKAAKEYAATMAQRKPESVKKRAETIRAKGMQIPEGIPTGYISAYFSKCGLTYSTILVAAKSGKIPSLVHEGKRYIDEAAATEYARQSKRARGKQNAEA